MNSFSPSRNLKKDQKRTKKLKKQKNREKSIILYHATSVKTIFNVSKKHAFTLDLSHRKWKKNIKNGIEHLVV